MRTKLFGQPNNYSATEGNVPKNRIKTTILGVFAAMAATILSACTGTSYQSTTPPDTAERLSTTADALHVLTTFTVTADMVAQVGGEHVVVQSLTPPGAEIHSWEPSPQDLAAASQTDLIIRHGLGLESWFTRFMDDLNVPFITVTEGIDPMPIVHGEYAGAANPHAWMSPDNAEVYVENITAALSAYSPEHSADFAANAHQYVARLREVSRNIDSRMAELPRAQRILVTCEGAFSYLARDLGLREYYIWPVNAEREATPRRVASVIDVLAAQDIPAVFCESTVGERPMRAIAEESGARFAGTLYVDSLTDSDGPAPTYLDLLTYNTDLIIEGLSAHE
ncbi:metal ABC transporter substrate-binding protein [Jonesia quinghaiensis]|uniref:metal ABC transporter substrate-binding protein n=1 Tax=Jonesia quinghaiensis TaxID=262806 RepID=UPI0009FED99B|nr:metal ABC transporter substrate-binding protein [Jonesia quinghaiensis]